MDCTSVVVENVRGDGRARLHVESVRADRRARLHVESARADGRARLHVENVRADGRAKFLPGVTLSTTPFDRNKWTGATWKPENLET